MKKWAVGSRSTRVHAGIPHRIESTLLENYDVRPTRAIGDEYNAPIGNALDIGSAAVLTASVGAAVVGCVVFLYRLGELMIW